MPTRIVIAGYRITSADATLSADDTVVNSRTGEPRSLAAVREALLDVDARLADDWKKAAQGRLQLSLRPFEKNYLKKLFQVSGKFSCQGSDTVQCPKGGPPLAMQTCAYDTDAFRILARKAPGRVCSTVDHSFSQSFLTALGGKILRSDWDGFASNCFTYAMRELTGWEKEVVLDDIFLEKSRENLHFAFPLEVLLQTFFRPAAVIPSKEIPIREKTPQQVIQEADAALNGLLRDGKLDEAKAVAGEYRMVFTLRANLVHDGRQKGVVLHSPHAGILHYDAPRHYWTLESKLGTGAQVFEAPVGAKMFLYHQGLVANGFHGNLFYRIYEMGLAEVQDMQILKEALKLEPIVDEVEGEVDTASQLR